MNWFYIRIAKNGGKSFKRAVAPYNNVIYLVAWKNFYKLHDRLKEPEDKYFTIVRNPYERAVSMWRYATYGPDRRYVKDWAINKDESFSDFLKRVKDIRERYEDYGFRKLSSGIIPYWGDSSTKRVFPEWIVEHTNSQHGIIKSFVNPDDVDIIMRLESIYEDKKLLEREIGGNIHVQHRNQTRKDREFMKCYDHKTENTAHAIWADDFEYLKIFYDL